MSEFGSSLGDGEFGDLEADVVIGENCSGSDDDGVGSIAEGADTAGAAGKYVNTDQRSFVFGRCDDTANRDTLPPPGPGRVMNTKGKRISVVEFLIVA